MKKLLVLKTATYWFLIIFLILSFNNSDAQDYNKTKDQSNSNYIQTEFKDYEAYLVIQLGHSSSVTSLAFSPDGKYILTGGWDSTVRLWEVESGKEVRSFSGHSRYIESVAFSPDGEYILTGSWDKTARLWDTLRDKGYGFYGKELIKLISFKDGTWAVVDSEGRFDAPDGGDVEGLHWVVGNEPIALSQLKDRYYEPGLLAKIMGKNKEALREVEGFKKVELYPSIDYEAPEEESTKIKINLTNRGGGIGKVRVLVNGKEVTKGTRGGTVQPKDKDAENVTLTVDLASAHVIAGESNEIEVIAYNKEGYIASRGVKREWIPKGEVELKIPELYAIVGGISDYKSADLRLTFAAKDAEDMAKALELGAKKLFGTEKTHITVLSTTGKEGTIIPTKSHFKKAFEDVASKAKPWDIMVVYLAGHGVSVGVRKSCIATLHRKL